MANLLAVHELYCTMKDHHNILCGIQRIYLQNYLDFGTNSSVLSGLLPEYQAIGIAV